MGKRTPRLGSNRHRLSLYNLALYRVALGHEIDLTDPQAIQLALMVAGRGGATKHSARRLAERGFTDEDVSMTVTGEMFRPADGATVYMKQVAPGAYNVIVQGTRGVVTGLKTITTSAVARLAKNYGWEWIP